MIKTVFFAIILTFGVCCVYGQQYYPRAPPIEPNYPSPSWSNGYGPGSYMPNYQSSSYFNPYPSYGYVPLPQPGKYMIYADRENVDHQKAKIVKLGDRFEELCIGPQLSYETAHPRWYYLGPYDIDNDYNIGRWQNYELNCLYIKTYN